MKTASVLDKPVQYIKMVGPRRASAMAKLNIFTLRDLFFHLPRDYEDRTYFRPAYLCEHNCISVIKGTVVGFQDLKPRKNLTITKADIHDGTSLFRAVWFNRHYIKKQLPPGTRVILSGKMDKSYGIPQLQVNDFEILSDENDLVHSGRIVPVYPLTERISQRTIRQIIFNALKEYLDEIEETLPGYIIEKHNFMDLKQTLKQIHFPDSIEKINNARRRLQFEELFLLQMVLAIRSKKNNHCPKVYRYIPSHKGVVHCFLDILPFKLTSAQKRVWQEIEKDIESQYPMNRLLQGDVGSGKTIISALALLKAVESGFQGALMAPTEILAEQHYYNLKEYFEKLGIKVALISGNLTGKEREKVLHDIASGSAQVIIGTHAIIQETVRFSALSLVVVDEQHRFGVLQRASLQKKGKRPDVLVMTATPIPRTLAMTLYGDLDVSIIDELPPGRQPVQTYAVKNSAIEKVYTLMKRELAAGRQAYVVCPLIEESDKIDISPAVEIHALLQKVFTGYNVGLLHGRMKREEKDKVMEFFRNGSINVLVTTSVIEVGVDVSNATIIVILDAQRFGLAQLHQLRGRVGRGLDKSYCILVSEASTVEARERLRAMTLTSDGFKLAEMDLQIRGPGEFFGTRQSGMLKLRIASLTDIKTMKLAREEAFCIIEKDPNLNLPDNSMLKAEISRSINSEESYLIL